jgi:hypothetical protein
MAYAICSSCGREVYWRATLGQRLADYTHAGCGGTLQGKTAGKSGANKGRTARTCVICGRRGFKLRQMAVAITVGRQGRSWLTGEMAGEPVALSVGDYAHGYHFSDEFPTPPNLPLDEYDAALDAPREQLAALFVGGGTR